MIEKLICLSTNQNVNVYSININNITRYFLTINIDLKNTNNSTVLLGFPGGGESIFTFLKYTSFNLIADQVIIFQGQTSGNIFTWQNAFPWLFINGAIEYQNDVSFVDTVIKTIFPGIKPNLFLTGKSDGAGFAVLYSNLSKYKNKIKAIGICSNANFGLGENNIGPYNKDNIFFGKDRTIIPLNIIVPPPNVSIFIMHGTADTVMPYKGQMYPGTSSAYNYVNTTLWEIIDPNLNGPPFIPNVISNTYNPDIPTYVDKIQQYSGISNEVSSTTVPNEYTSSTYNNSNNNVLNFIKVIGQDHDWSGHLYSGPNSSDTANTYLDATYLMIKFFDLNIGSYTPTVTTIPTGFLNYKNITI
jgi:poly(3-hydroxybutyrate) depolymerase